MNENYINHINLVLDASGSMQGKTNQVITVADNQVEYLARRSKELDQETRITVYTFDSTVKCLFYDKDVLRLPSMRNLYRPNGNTALIDATLKSLDDLSKTATLYGDHAFLTYVLTDGQENASITHPGALQQYLNKMPENWTTAVFVPDQNGVFEAKKFGFPSQNIAVWDTSAKGLAEVGETIRRTTDTFMQARATGNFRGSASIFTLDLSNLNVNKLQKLSPMQYQLYNVLQDTRIDYYVPHVGKGYYQLTKTEEIQPQKQICIMEKRTGNIYAGAEARRMLGLPNDYVKVPPTYNPEYEIFVQSTAPNRKLIGGTKVLVMA